MKTARTLAVAALLLVACAKEATVKAPPRVVVSPEIQMTVRPSVILGASAIASSPIKSFEWTLVSSPDPAKAKVGPLTDRGDLAQLTTGGVPGLYVVAVAVTDEEGERSAPGFINVHLVPPPVVLNVGLACSTGCSTASSGKYEAPEASTLTFTATATTSAATFKWNAVLARDPEDSLSGEGTIASEGGTATVLVPAVAKDAELTVSVTASEVGHLDATAVARVTIKNSADDPPTITLEWRVAGMAPGADVKLLPGDAVFVRALVSDPNGDPVTCAFSRVVPSDPLDIQNTADSCRVIVYPRASGTFALGATATTAAPAATAQATPISLVAQPFRTENGVGLSSVAATSDGRAIATASGKDYYVYELGGAVAGTKVTGSFNGGIATAVAADIALIGYSSTPSFGRYDLYAAAAPLPAFRALDDAGLPIDGGVPAALDAGAAPSDAAVLADASIAADGGIASDAGAPASDAAIFSDGGVILTDAGPDAGVPDAGPKPGGVKMSDVTWAGVTGAPPARTRAMTVCPSGRIWSAMDLGIAVLSDLATPAIGPAQLKYWTGGAIAPTAIACGGNAKAGQDAYVWYAEGTKVYVQTTESLSNWGNTKGTLLGDIADDPAVAEAPPVYPAISSLCVGPASVPDLWAGTGVAGGAQVAGGLFLFEGSVAASGTPGLNDPAGYEPLVQGEVSSIAVETDGIYVGDAWAVVDANLYRVSRVQLGANERVIRAMRILTAFDGHVKAVAVAGRRVLVATDSQGLAVLP